MVACEPGFAPSMVRELELGRDAADRWIGEGSATSVSPSTAISLGYLERLRLGLGSPFRLADQALQDLRLGDTNRRDLAWAILARTLDRDAYQIESHALDGISRTGAAGSGPGSGLLHLELIDRVIRESADPRAGELAVRLAYTRAAAGGAVDAAAPQLAAGAAALLRDRELAREDVRRLLAAANEADADPLTWLGAWRTRRQFAVEAPPIQSLSPESQEKAVEAATRLGQAVRQFAQRGVRHGRAGQRDATLLPPAVAWRLVTLVDSANPPPQAPVAVAVSAVRSAMLAPELDERSHGVREQFVEKAASEEAFAARYALLQQPATATDAAASAALSAAVALRAYAQEPVWFPGFPAPTAAEVEARHGVAEIRFDDGVPAPWQPYYLRLIDVALADLRSVLPALDLSGLRVLVSRHGVPEGTLALHDPRRRRLILPPESGAGTIAHEIAHDLDWQVALLRYGVRGDYASDGATGAPRDPLAMRLADLANTATEALGSNGANSHSRRPAEVFARNVDWFVAVTLAAHGRSNGYLTSIQDDVLIGYGSARPPDVTGTAGEALVRILDEVAPLDPDTRQGFLAQYGRGRTLTLYDQARRLLEAPAIR